MIRTIFSLGSIVFMVALVATGTTAFFSDTESSTDNIFTAGAIDLKIDNESYYNGAVSEGTTWLQPADLNDGFGPGENGEYFFFNFLDLKPDDEGEDTISIHVDDNDAWACMYIDVTDTPENGCNEPEAGDGDVTCADDEGELQNEINFVWWADDGDNVLEDDEAESRIIHRGSLADMSLDIPLADSNGLGVFGPDPLLAGETYYIGKAWCFGTLGVDPETQDGLPGGNDNGPLDRGTGISCDGSGLDNTTQSDSVMGDITFTAVQSRHNDNFVCTDGGGIGCNEKGDVMFVLDSSGSIGDTNITTVENAAKAFALALAPSVDGNHIGVVDFDDDATLEQELTDVFADIESAIDSITSGGLTNMGDGILLASQELASVRDRADLTSPDYMVIITDGQPNTGSDPEVVAQAAKDAGTTIYVVGVGDGVNQAYLEGIATSPNHYFGAGEFDDLESVLSGIANCENNGAINNNN